MGTWVRQTFAIDTDTGLNLTTVGDSGPKMWGEVRQIRWAPGALNLDTGASLQIALLPKDGDSGDGFVIYEENDNLIADWVRYPRMPFVYSTGVANTGDSGYETIVAAGDRLRVKITPGYKQCKGNLYVWSKD